MPGTLWAAYARRDERNRELAFPPHGLVMSYAKTAVPVGLPLHLAKIAA